MHTHANFTAGWDDTTNQFDVMRYRKYGDIYTATPCGKLLKWDVKLDKEFVISDRLPYDPNDPNNPESTQRNVDDEKGFWESVVIGSAICGMLFSGSECTLIDICIL